MEVIHCKNCGGSTIPFDTVSVNVTLNKSSWCKCCYRSNTEEQNHFFCSEQCFHAFMLSVVNGEKDIKWRDHSCQHQAS
jgi:hypothetical protein